MAVKQDLNLSRAERRKFIIRLRGHGYQLKEIAEVIGSSTSQVSYDLKIINADADDVCDDVREAARDLLTKKMKAEFNRIKKAQAESDAEMDDLITATMPVVFAEGAKEHRLGVPTVESLDEWFNDEPEDESEDMTSDLTDEDKERMDELNDFLLLRGEAPPHSLDRLYQEDE